MGCDIFLRIIVGSPVEEIDETDPFSRDPIDEDTEIDGDTEIDEDTEIDARYDTKFPDVRIDENQYLCLMPIGDFTNDWAERWQHFYGVSIEVDGYFSAFDPKLLELQEKVQQHFDDRKLNLTAKIYYTVNRG